MKHVPKISSIAYSGEGFIAHEYETDNPHINIARVEVSSRFPAQGWKINEISTMVVYIQSGMGKLITEKNIASVNNGDVIEILQGEKYVLEPDSGQTLIIISSYTPAWTTEQNKTVPE